MANKATKGIWRYVVVVGACFAIAFGLSTVAERIDNYAYDVIASRFRPDWEPQSVVVAIDDKTFAALGGPRARREILSQALDELTAAQPKLVAIDMILHDPGDPIEDARLEASLRATPNLILPCDLVPDRGNDTWEDPLPRFAPADPHRLGHVEWATDALDGVTRQIPLEKIAAHQQRWALSLVAASVSLDQPIVTSSDSKDIRLGDLAIPIQKGSADRPLLIRYLPEERIPRISVLEIGNNRSKIRGKAVFLGETAPASGDRLQDPYGETVPGVMVNVQAFETLMHGDYLTRARDYSVLLTSLGIAVAAGLIFAMLAGWPAYAVGAVLLAFAHSLPVVLFRHNIVFPYFAPVAVAWLCSIGAATYQHFFVRRELDRTESERSRYQQAIHWAAHEMRTPLTAIQGSSEIMTRYNLPEEKRNQLSGMINSESKRLARIIQTFLDVERLADGQMELKREPFEAAAMVTACMQRVLPLAEGKQIAMTLEGEVDGVLVGDLELMEYAFYNLLTNAVKYSRSGTQIRVFSERNGGELRLAVQDQGIGMDSKEVQNVFKKFYRTKGAEASGEVGTGIGLSIVEQIVTRHGGRIDVASEPGKGSCFTIVMKVRPVKVEARLRKMQRLLIVEDDQSVRTTMVLCLELEGYAVEAVSSTHEAIDRLERQSYPIVISDIYLDERTGIDVLRTARRQNPACAVILMTGRGSMETVMAATEGGAFEYLAKPFEMAHMIDTIKRAEKSLAGDESDEAAAIDDLPDTEMIGSSPRMIEIYKTISHVAPTDATVLIEGETGTGKELIARMIHRNSRRASQSFAPVDCGAIAPSLLESELFGTLKGAYTGADRDRMGVFEAAAGGTVFLDEIGDIDLGFQLKLLRFLQEREVRPLGSARARKVDVRVIAATNRDVQKFVEEGKFREDLWYRLNVVRLTVPPLCERPSDIPLLVHYFLKRYNGRYKLDAKLTDSGLKALEDYSWPGNIRQLQHMMERLVILAPGGRIDLPAVRHAIEQMDSRESSSETLADTEAEQIRRVLAATNGNKSRAAKILGIERKTLYRKLEKMAL